MNLIELFEGEVDRIVGSTLRRYGLVLTVSSTELMKGHDWIALRVDPETEIPDALERGAFGSREIQTYETWAKVPRSSVECTIRIR